MTIEIADFLKLVFEDKELADQAVVAVEKQIHHEDSGEGSKEPAIHLKESHETKV